MNEVGSAVMAVLGGGVGLWAIRVFRTAMTAQAEVNDEKNQTIERLAVELRECREEIRTLQAALWEARRQGPA